MRNLYLILLFVLLLQPLVSQAQYVPFPEDSATWIERYTLEGEPNVYRYYYQITKDTMINGIVYQKLNKNLNEEGAIRNDVAAKKVYFFHKDSLQEELLYDFNLVPGDTITSYSNDISFSIYGYENTAIIDSIDSVLIDGSYRKRWNYTSNRQQGLPFNFFYDGNYIEGIGNTNGLINGLESSDWVTFFLVCFKEKEHTLWSNTFDTNECSIYSAVKELNAKQTAMVYPNPFNDVIYLDNLKGIKSVAVYGLLGELQFKATAPNKNIDLGFLKKGIYFINITTQTGITNQKIVKL